MKTNSYKYSHILVIIIGVISILVGILFNVSFIEKYLSPDGNVENPKVIWIFQAIVIISGLILITISCFYKYKFYDKFVRFVKVIITNLLLTLATIFILCFIGEVISKYIIYKVDRICGDGVGPHGRIWHKRYVKPNSHGFRDYEYPIKKKEGIYRILGLGDSYTFGHGINKVEDTYLKRLEKMLNNTLPNKLIEVINIANCGYNVKQELDVLRKKGLSFNPDIIIIGFTLNDIEGLVPMPENIYKEHHPLIPQREIWQFLYHNSYFFYFLDNKYDKFIKKYFAKGNYQDGLLSLYSKDSPSFKKFEEYYLKIFNICKEKKIKCILVIFPAITVVNNKKYPFLLINNKVKSLCKNKDIIVIDMLPIFKKYKYQNLICHKDDAHPNEFAHSLTSKAIFEVILSNNLLR